jgi:hypothetical protein
LNLADYPRSLGQGQPTLTFHCSSL